MPARQSQPHLWHIYIVHPSNTNIAHLISYTCMPHQQHTHLLSGTQAHLISTTHMNPPAHASSAPHAPIISTIRM